MLNFQPRQNMTDDSHIHLQDRRSNGHPAISQDACARLPVDVEDPAYGRVLNISGEENHTAFAKSRFSRCKLMVFGSIALLSLIVLVTQHCWHTPGVSIQSPDRRSLAGMFDEVKTHFKLGDRVKAQCSVKPGWFKATIMQVHDDHTFNLLWDARGYPTPPTEKQPAELIRLLTEADDLASQQTVEFPMEKMTFHEEKNPFASDKVVAVEVGFTSQGNKVVTVDPDGHAKKNHEIEPNMIIVSVDGIDVPANGTAEEQEAITARVKAGSTVIFQGTECPCPPEFDDDAE